MDSRKIGEVDFCFNDILSLFGYRQVKADRSQLRKGGAGLLEAQTCLQLVLLHYLHSRDVSQLKKHTSRPAVVDATTPSPGRC